MNLLNKSSKFNYPICLALQNFRLRASLMRNYFSKCVTYGALKRVSKYSIYTSLVVSVTLIYWMRLINSYDMTTSVIFYLSYNESTFLFDITKQWCHKQYIKWRLNDVSTNRGASHASLHDPITPNLWQGLMVWFYVPVMWMN